ncbi:MAG: ribbon-helix-helix protein, CopG family [Myxococcales bacterium]|nr:ribbon-helix-helix protein, CopG family [Myxococcales bacterium]
MPVSLRLPSELLVRLSRLVEERDTSAHAFMLEAIREKIEAEEAQAEFHAAARRRLARMKRTGVGIPADEVFRYLRARAGGEKPRRPKARKLT